VFLEFVQYFLFGNFSLIIVISWRVKPFSFCFCFFFSNALFAFRIIFSAQQFSPLFVNLVRPEVRKGLPLIIFIRPRFLEPFFFSCDALSGLGRFPRLVSFPLRRIFRPFPIGENFFGTFSRALLLFFRGIAILSSWLLLSSATFFPSCPAT